MIRPEKKISASATTTCRTLRHGLALLTSYRQSQLLRGLQRRFQLGNAQRTTTVVSHQTTLASLEQSLAEQHEQVLADCRGLRRQVLTSWDQVDDQAIATYESNTLTTRDRMLHELAALRKKRKQDIANEEEWYDREVKQVNENYLQEKPRPLAQQKQEIGLIGKRTARLQEIIDPARELAARRLGGPAAVEAIEAATPQAVRREECESQTLKECFQELDRIGDEAADKLRQLQSGLAVKFTESFYLLFVIAAAVVLWIVMVLLAAPQRTALWCIGSVPFAIIVGFVVHLIMGKPLRQQTRQLYPVIDSLKQEGARWAEIAQRVSVAKAREWSAEIQQQRDQSLERLHREHTTKMLGIKERYQIDLQSTTQRFETALLEIEQQFRQQYMDQSRQMTEKSEATALQLRQRIEASEQNRTHHLLELKKSQAAELSYLQQRIEQGVSRGLSRIDNNNQLVSARILDWDTLLQQGMPDEPQSLRWLYLGDIDIKPVLSSALGDQRPNHITSLPLVLPREAQAALIVDCPPEQMHVAADWLRGVLWRSLVAARPGSLRLTLLDPVGRGQNFASLVALGDYDPTLISHRAWVSPQQIADRTSELTQHIEDVLQACLRDRYRTLEDFNEQAGPLAEPYRILAAFGLPAGLNQESAQALRALVEGGRRCGIFTIIVRDTSQGWGDELPQFANNQTLRLRICEQGRLWHTAPGMESLEIRPLTGPPATAIPVLAEKIGRAAIAAHRVEIPLDECVPESQYDSGDSSRDLVIPVGRQGVGRLLEISLGTGMRQHMLIAGKTGSGKSTLLHSLIMAAAMKYSPDELHLYLLDFKKGVEFKVYAESQLPHARVIGIESEREFGRSVLERLDEELQRRGELFRAAGVQDLAEYRRRTESILPRVLLVVDEFQELFVRDDRVAQECTMLLDRLVRQGRSFGMHVVLSSQSLSGAYSLPRATLGQMAIRIALQCSEADAAMILADDNTAARLLNRPGEAIFNDAGGLIEGNQPFQVAWMGQDLQRERIAEIVQRHPDTVARLGLPVVFEGNRPARWSVALAEQSLRSPLPVNEQSLCGLLGEGVKIGPPATLSLPPVNGRNILCVADVESTLCVIASWLPTAMIDWERRRGKIPRVHILDGTRTGEASINLQQWLLGTGLPHQWHRPRDAEATVVGLANELASQLQQEHPIDEPTILIVLGLERFRELRQDDNFGFSLDGSSATGGSVALQTLLRDGPQVGFHTFLSCGGVDTLTRWLPRSSHHDLELRIAGRMSANDSAQLIDTPEATDLAGASLLFYDDAEGRVEKFRICAMPAAEQVEQWRASPPSRSDTLGS